MTNRIRTDDWWYSEWTQRWKREDFKHFYPRMCFIWEDVLVGIHNPVNQSITAGIQNPMREGRSTL